MAQRKRILITALTLTLCGAAPASAQKQGGILRVFFFDSPASMSIHEEATIAGQGPIMGVFNNLILYDQKVPQAGMKSIVPDLASACCLAAPPRSCASIRARPGMAISTRWSWTPTIRSRSA